MLKSINIGGSETGDREKKLTDANAYGMSEAFLQMSEDGWRALTFPSKLLRKAELSYTVREKECFAVVYAIGKWRHYFRGGKFVIVASQLLLKWPLSLHDPRDRLAWCVLSMENFDFRFVHAKCSTMVVQDTFSWDADRNPLCQRYYAPLLQLDDVKREIFQDAVR